MVLSASLNAMANLGRDHIIQGNTVK